jgi:ABC-2 type transport system permease protein
MALLGPFILAAIMIVPVGLNMQSKEHTIIEVLDQDSFKKEEINIHHYFENNDEVSYVFMHGEPDDIKSIFLNKSTHDALLIMPKYPSDTPVQFFSKTPISRSTIAKTETALLNYQKDVFLLKSAKTSSGFLTAFNQRFKIKDIHVEYNAYEHVFNDTAATVGLTAGIMIYFFILIYGIQVMRGVIEEKTNRILEVLVITVKPFELMMGKILGIGAVSIVQFLIWITVTSFMSFVVTDYFKLDMYSNANIAHTLTFVNDTAKAMEMNRFVTSMTQMNIPYMILLFLVYFMLAYLLYSALFSAIGAAVDAETDTQQFVLPITVPLLISFLLAQNIIANPDGKIAIWLSFIPFTSPIVMMLRLPFGVENWQILLSVMILLITFIGTTYVASRIFRIGILMYGKKVTIGEILKWIYQ